MSILSATAILVEQRRTFKDFLDTLSKEKRERGNDALVHATIDRGDESRPGCNLTGGRYGKAD